MCSRVLKLLKSLWHHFYHNFPLFQEPLSLKTSLLVTSKILGLFGNTLTADHMYSRHYFRGISATCSNAIISKTENIFRNFYSISAIWTKFCAFWKKRSASYLKYFESYWLQEMCLLECPEASVLEHSPRVNAFTGIKHLWNRHANTFIINFH